jgi:lysophospholipase L1-like esterase
MKRLVYSPSVNVWIKTDTGIFDLSPYITSFYIDRRINEVSQATVSFRNPRVTDERNPNRTRMLFTEHLVGNSVRPMFHPMDPIIITLTRLKGRPIQVFTGYCDTTPYVQLKPGEAKITASCTLKKLQYTYWDPALPFVRDFMQKNGWNISEQGLAFNPNNKFAGKLHDGSIGYLLYTVLNEIGGWDPNNIYIQDLPGDQIKTIVRKLYEDTSKASNKASKEFTSFLSDLIGSAKYGSAGGGGGSTSGSDVTLVGDSITVDSQDQIEEKISGITIYAERGKHMSLDAASGDGGDSGITILTKKKNDLKKTIVIELGSNDEDVSDPATFEKMIDDAITAAGSDKQFAFVTVTNNDDINTAINNKRDEHNLTVIDWKAKSSGNLSSDGLHPNEEGKKVLAKLIADEIGISNSSAGLSQYNKQQLKDLWITNGGKRSAANIAAAVALAESGGDPHNRGPETGTNSNGTVDWGLWQINTVHTQYYPNGSEQNMLNPDKNCDAAIAISNNGSDWTPWTTYNNDKYKEYL